MKRRKMRKQVRRSMNCRSWSHEDNERVIDILDGKVYDLVASTGRNKRSAGELTPRLAPPQRNGATAVEINGVWYWEYKGE